MASRATQNQRSKERGTSRKRRPSSSRGLSWWERIKIFFSVLLGLFLIATLGVVGYVNYTLRAATKVLPTSDSLLDYTPGGVTEIFATDKDPKTGKNVLLGRVYSKYREFSPITDIPENLKNATVAVEDERFYSHPGVDLRGIGRSLYRDVRGGKMGEGGSTLTQQLARNIILNDNKKTLNRKIQEAILAVQLERNYSKEEILEMYMNEVFYGANAYGVKAAAKIYFGKALKDLTIAEAALIAGLPQRPSSYDPFQNPKVAMERRNTVLGKMAELKYITPQQFEEAKKVKIKLVPQVKETQTIFKAPYFTNYVLKQLVAKYGKDVVYKNGLKVYTTLNWQMQQDAENAIRSGVRAGAGDKVTEGALVSLEPRTGYVRAMVGGVDYKNNEFNNVTQGRRQPGSSFKVFVYTAAFMANQNRWNPDTDINDAPTHFGRYSPKNYDGRYHGYVSIRQAVTHSYNVPAVIVANAIGVQRVIDCAQSMGIKSLMKPDLSLALGSREVTPLELASAYSVFPNHGSHAQPMSIIRVVDSEEKTLENNAPQVDRAIVPESVAADMSSMLSDVVTRGTAAGAEGIHEIEDPHGKTGTTNDNKDAWFVGYTSELCTAVWVCGVTREKKNGNVRVRYREMDGVTGGHVCAPIWARFMKTAVAIQRTANEPIQKSPEKTVPTEKTIDAVVGRHSRRPRADADENNTPVEEARPHRAASVNTVPTPTATPAAEDTQPVVTSTPKPEASATPEPERNVPTPRAERPVRSEQPPREEPAPREERTASVTLCSESHLRATRWCPETITRTLPVSQIPRRSCRLHKPRPGDE